MKMEVKEYKLFLKCYLLCITDFFLKSLPINMCDTYSKLSY